MSDYDYGFISNLSCVCGTRSLYTVGATVRFNILDGFVHVTHVEISADTQLHCPNCGTNFHLPEIDMHFESIEENVYKLAIEERETRVERMRAHAEQPEGDEHAEQLFRNTELSEKITLVEQAEDDT
jgi:hypothetical protein